MSRRWTLEEAAFLVRFFDAVGDYVGTHDLNRPKGAATNRVAKLKTTGAWDSLVARHVADYQHLRTYYQAVGAPADVAMLDMMHPGAPEDTKSQKQLKPAMRLDVWRLNSQKDDYS